MLETFCLESASRNPRLRIGLLLDSFLLPAWIASILEQIGRSNYADLSLHSAEPRSRREDDPGSPSTSAGPFGPASYESQEEEPDSLPTLQ